MIHPDVESVKVTTTRKRQRVLYFQHLPFIINPKENVAFVVGGIRLNAFVYFILRTFSLPLLILWGTASTCVMLETLEIIIVGPVLGACLNIAALPFPLLGILWLNHKLTIRCLGTFAVQFNIINLFIAGYSFGILFPLQWHSLISIVPSAIFMLHFDAYPRSNSTRVIRRIAMFAYTTLTACIFLRSSFYSHIPSGYLMLFGYRVEFIMYLQASTFNLVLLGIRNIYCSIYFDKIYLYLNAFAFSTLNSDALTFCNTGSSDTTTSGHMIKLVNTFQQPFEIDRNDMIFSRVFGYEIGLKFSSLSSKFMNITLLCLVAPGGCYIGTLAVSKLPYNTAFASCVCFLIGIFVLAFFARMNYILVQKVWDNFETKFLVFNCILFAICMSALRSDFRIVPIWYFTFFMVITVFVDAHPMRFRGMIIQAVSLLTFCGASLASLFFRWQEIEDKQYFSVSLMGLTRLCLINIIMFYVQSLFWVIWFPKTYQMIRSPLHELRISQKDAKKITDQAIMVLEHQNQAILL